MANKHPKLENLKAPLSPIEARINGRKGGLKSVEVRKERKLMSQMLADYLAKEHEVVIRDDDGAVIDREKISAEELISRTVTAVMARGDSASATMIKTLGELTEGKKIDIAGSVDVVTMTREQRQARIKELLEKRESGK